MQVVTIHNDQTDEKHKGCNLRLNTATEHEETMSLGNELSTVQAAIFFDAAVAAHSVV